MTDLAIGVTVDSENEVVGNIGGLPSWPVSLHVCLAKQTQR